MSSKIIVISGGSSGIGLATATLFSEKDCIVYELSRHGENHNNINHITCDVTDVASVESAFNTIYTIESRIDVLINNAGYGISGAVESTELSSAKKQFDVNFFGTFNCIKCVVPIMRENGGGTIINISSIASVLSIPFQSFYSASKSAINSLTLALASELQPFNIKVVAVLPGDVHTGFTESRIKSEDNKVYGKTIEKSVATMERDEQNGMSPSLLAKHIYKLTTKRHPKLISTVGFQYKLFLFLNRILPTKLVNFVIRKMYAS